MERTRQGEAALHGFLQNYFARVDPLLTKRFARQAGPNPLPPYPPAPAADPFCRAERKRLYRALAKRHHPDNAPGGSAMPAINDAYDRSDLVLLWRLWLRDAGQGTPADALARIEQTIAHLLAYSAGRRQSAAYRLMQRAEQATRQGWDLTETVARQFEREGEYA